MLLALPRRKGYNKTLSRSGAAICRRWIMNRGLFPKAPRLWRSRLVFIIRVMQARRLKPSLPYRSAGEVSVRGGEDWVLMNFGGEGVMSVLVGLEFSSIEFGFEFVANFKFFLSVAGELQKSSFHCIAWIT